MTNFGPFYGQGHLDDPSLRHAAASLFIEQGWNPKRIQTIPGHASISMTLDVFGHLFECVGEDVALFEKLESDLLAAWESLSEWTIARRDKAGLNHRTFLGAVAIGQMEDVG